MLILDNITDISNNVGVCRNYGLQVRSGCKTYFLLRKLLLFYSVYVSGIYRDNRWLSKCVSVTLTSHFFFNIGDERNSVYVRPFLVCLTANCWQLSM